MNSLCYSVAHNNQLPGEHFRKEWDTRVKTWLDQPARKVRRRNARKAKAAAVAPRPVDKLRPAVRGQSQRYNSKVKLGRGFTLGEIRGAGLTPAGAQTIGISVDHRRTNKSEETKAANIARLRAYVSTVVVKEKGGKASKMEGGKVKSVPVKALKSMAQASEPAPRPARDSSASKAVFVTVTEEMKGLEAHRTLRQEWINAKVAGKRAKKAKEAAEAAEKAGDKKPDAE